MTDRDSRFTSVLTRAVCEMIGTRQAISTAYHPQTDGQTERVNRVLEDMLRHYVSPSQDDWDEKLDCAEFAINNSLHSSNQESPFMQNYGRAPYLPVSVTPHARVPSATHFVQQMQRRMAEATHWHKLAIRRQKQYADQHRVDVHFQPDQWVLLNSMNLKLKVGTPKLLPRWVGPFQVKGSIGEVAYELILPNRWKLHDVFHVSQLQAYRSDGSVQPPPAELLTGELEYEVDYISSHRDTPYGKKGKTKREYFVHWRGCASDHGTWEPVGHLRNAPQVIKDYWDSVSTIFTQGITSDEPLQPASADDTPAIPVIAASLASSPRSLASKRRSRRKMLASAHSLR